MAKEPHADCVQVGPTCLEAMVVGQKNEEADMASWVAVVMVFGSNLATYYKIPSQQQTMNNLCQDSPRTYFTTHIEEH